MENTPSGSGTGWKMVGDWADGELGAVSFSGFGPRQSGESVTCVPGMFSHIALAARIQGQVVSTGLRFLIVMRIRLTQPDRCRRHDDTYKIAAELLRQLSQIYSSD
jgi:hypothetical protein